MSNEYGIILETKDFEKSQDEVDKVLSLVKYGIYDFVQFVVEPDTYKNLHKFVKEKFRGIKTVIHAPFFMNGVNLSDSDLQDSNLQKISDSQKFADDLKSDVIVLHPGIGEGEKFLDENIRQMKILNDPRIAVENLPYKPCHGHKTLGSIPEQIKKITDEVGCHFCFDIAHAICAINSLKLDIDSTLTAFNNLKPIIYYLSDGDNCAEVDYHLHLGKENYDLQKIFGLFSDSRIVLETRKKAGELAACIEDIQFAKKIRKSSLSFQTLTTVSSGISSDAADNTQSPDYRFLFQQNS